MNGIIHLGGRGINGLRFLALSCISRYIIAAKLVAALRRGDGAIISIKAAGSATSLDADDIELKKLKTISFFGILPLPLECPDWPPTANAMREGAIHDVFAQEFEPRTGVPYYHFYPGLVNTNSMETYQVGFLFYYLIKFLSLFVGYTPIQWAPVPVSVALKRPSYTTLSEKGTEAPVKAAIRETELRNKVLVFFEKASGLQLGGD
jgi:hypothetical protein